MGASLDQLKIHETADANFFSVKESVFPFAKFPGVDVILGPEMRSTGEVMGADRSLPVAFAKAQMAAGVILPTSGKVFFQFAKVIGALRSTSHAVSLPLGSHLFALAERTSILQRMA